MWFRLIAWAWHPICFYSLPRRFEMQGLNSNSWNTAAEKTKKHGNNRMKRIILMLCIFSALLTAAYAGEIYRCTDRDGNTIITNNPQDGMGKCVLKDTYNDSLPQEKRMMELKKIRLNSGGKNSNSRSSKDESSSINYCSSEKSFCISKCHDAQCINSCSQAYARCMSRDSTAESSLGTCISGCSSEQSFCISKCHDAQCRNSCSQACGRCISQCH